MELVRGRHCCKTCNIYSGDYLVMHLSELVRTSFIAATASVDQLKLAGYEALRVTLDCNIVIATCMCTYMYMYMSA